jgi:hypothetical protein
MNASQNITYEEFNTVITKTKDPLKNSANKIKAEFGNIEKFKVNKNLFQNQNNNPIIRKSSKTYVVRKYKITLGR